MSVVELSGGCPLLASAMLTIQEEEELRTSHRRDLLRYADGSVKVSPDYVGLTCAWYYAPKTMELSEHSVQMLKTSRMKWRYRFSLDKLSSLFPGCVLIDARSLGIANVDGAFAYPSYNSEANCPVLCFVGAGLEGLTTPVQTGLFLKRRSIGASRLFTPRNIPKQHGPTYIEPSDGDAARKPGWKYDRMVIFNRRLDMLIALICEGSLVPVEMPPLEGRAHIWLVTEEEWSEITSDGASSEGGERSGHAPPSTPQAHDAITTSSLSSSGSGAIPDEEPAEERTLEQVGHELRDLREAHNQLLERYETYHLETETKQSMLFYHLREAENQNQALASALLALRQRADLIDSLEIPVTPHDALRVATAAYPDRLFVHSAALKSAQEYTQGSAPEVWEALRDMAVVLHPLIFDERSSDVSAIFESRSRFEVALTEGLRTNKDQGLMRIRRIEYEGCEVDIVAHVKGRQRKAGATMRIHFYADHANNVLVIGYCGNHLPTYTDNNHT